MNDREKLKNYLFDIYAEIFHANNDYKKCDFYWILGYEIFYSLYDYIGSHSLFGIRIEIDMGSSNIIKLCKVMYGGTYEG